MCFYKNLLRCLLLLAVSAVAALAVSCSDDAGSEDLDIQFDVPESLTLPSDASEIQFRVKFGKSPESSDMIAFEDESGVFNSSAITSISSRYFSCEIYEGMLSGVYNVYIQRGDARKKMGRMSVVFADDVELDGDNNVYGVVTCGDKKLKGVVVSDGVETAVTDENGIYQFKSEKSLGYVFLSVPSGYEVSSDGVLPKFHVQLSLSPSMPERADFVLKEAPDQTDHTMLVFGDIHLAARNNDRNQFREFTDDVNDWLSANKGKSIYGMTLGDMTWDLYWVTNKYAFEEYLADANAIQGLQIFHTIGNHDHEMSMAGDFDTVKKYRKEVAPTYYSFNIGKVHYVVLDDIECTNSGAGDRTYNNKVVNEQLDWLEKDLSYVSEDTPVVVAMHAPLYSDLGFLSVGNSSRLKELLEPFPEVHFMTGHTHKMYNTDKLSEEKIYEHNSAAVCATWWWTGKYNNGMNICQDGTPGGYRIFDVDGKSFSWVYKPTGASEKIQFRTYDGNSVTMSANAWVPDASDEGKKLFENYAGMWKDGSNDNYVYINVWDYDPSWDVTVIENGHNLNVEKIREKDPLHLIAYTAISINGNSKTPTFPTSETRHMFRCKASSPNSTLSVKVTDRFGNVYEEVMTRPKKFDIETYRY